MKGYDMRSKDIKLCETQKELLVNALQNVIDVIFAKQKDMARIYERMVKDIGRTPLDDNGVCYINLFGGEYDCALFALRHVSEENKSEAEKLIKKIENAPYKTYDYYA